MSEAPSAKSETKQTNAQSSSQRAGDSHAFVNLTTALIACFCRRRTSPKAYGSLVHVINLDQTDSGAAVLSSQDGGKGPRRQ